MVSENDGGVKLVVWILFLFVSIVSTGIFLGSDFLVKAFYYLKQSEYKDASFMVTNVVYSRSHQTIRKQRFSVCGKLQFSQDEAILSASDFINVSGVSSTEELQRRVKDFGDMIPVKFRDEKSVFINQRNMNLIPSKLVDGVTVFTLFFDFFKYNWVWVGVWMLKSSRKKYLEGMPVKTLAKPLGKTDFFSPHQ
jgi:hypothetical protein